MIEAYYAYKYEEIVSIFGKSRAVNNEDKELQLESNGDTDTLRDIRKDESYIGPLLMRCRKIML